MAESWWARYSPHIYIFALACVFCAGVSPARLPRVLANATAVILLANNLAIIAVKAPACCSDSRDFDAAVGAPGNSGRRTALLYHMTAAGPYFNLKDRGFEPILVPEGAPISGGVVVKPGNLMFHIIKNYQER